MIGDTSFSFRVMVRAPERRLGEDLDMEPISYSLRDVLVRQGIANGKPVGAGKVRGRKGAGVSYGSDDPQVSADREVERRMGMSMGKRVSYAPFLMVIEGGRK